MLFHLNRAKPTNLQTPRIRYITNRRVEFEKLDFHETVLKSTDGTRAVRNAAEDLTARRRLIARRHPLTCLNKKIVRSGSVAPARFRSNDRNKPRVVVLP